MDNLANKRILRLTLKKEWFDMVSSGEKREEYRDSGRWIISRLEGRRYDFVEFSNGYGAHVPKVLVEFLGWRVDYGRPDWGATSGVQQVVIELGKVVKRIRPTGRKRWVKPAAPVQLLLSI